MLVLGRNTGDRVRVVVLGPDGKPQKLVVTLCKIKGDGVRLGFEGPECFKVIRDELPTLPEASADERGVLPPNVEGGDA